MVYYGSSGIFLSGRKEGGAHAVKSVQDAVAQLKKKNSAYTKANSPSNPAAVGVMTVGKNQDIHWDRGGTCLQLRATSSIFRYHVVHSARPCSSATKTSRS